MWRHVLAFLGRDSESAVRRGARLLRDNLSPEQLAAYLKAGSFDVIGGDTGRRYRIYRANLMNIAEFDAQGHRAWTWCFCPEGNLVWGDNMLAQKLALELFETEALAKANRHPTSRLNQSRRSLTRLWHRQATGLGRTPVCPPRGSS